MIRALTEFETIDAAVGATRLRAVLDSSLVGHASPPLVTEARGVVAMLSAMLGYRQRALDDLAITFREITDHGAGGVARAPADIAFMMIVGGCVGDDRAGFDEIWQNAAFHSQGTPYRSHFNYLFMLCSYITCDLERAVSSYAEIQAEGRWAQYSPRFDRMARLSYAVILSGRGQFGAAHAELSRITGTKGDTISSAELIIHALLTHRLDLAKGIVENVLSDTSESGPLWSERIQRTQPRYVPGAIMIRGAALWRRGMKQSGGEHFLRATEQAVILKEFLSLAAVETEEYREWLDTLSPFDLPPGIPADVYEALRSRPLLIDRSLPTLTQQQSRILHRLAMGRSAASIAAELAISTNTLKTHLRLLYRRLGAGSRKQALILAEEYGLLR